MTRRRPLKLGLSALNSQLHESGLAGLCARPFPFFLVTSFAPPWRAGNDGLSPAATVKTLAHGASLLRDGFPDHLLLKRDDVWTDESLGTTTNGRRFLNGRSADEPMVVSYYGDTGARPKLNCGLQHFVDHNGQSRSHVSYLGLHLRTPRINPNDPAYAGNNNDRCAERDRREHSNAYATGNWR